MCVLVRGCRWKSHVRQSHVHLCCVIRAADVEAMDIFRAVLARNEKSQRALRLTEAVIHLSPSHYTAWTFRWQCIQELDADLEQELLFVNHMTRSHPKNYQVWCVCHFCRGRTCDGSSRRGHHLLLWNSP